MAIPAAPSALLLDLLMAVMNSVETWALAAGDERAGLAWRESLIISRGDLTIFVERPDRGDGP